MKRLYSKRNSHIKFFFIVLVALCGIIYGCRKEITNSKESTLNTDPAVTDAKTWYESTFPVNGSSNQTVHTNSTGTGFDLSQRVKPDWQHTATYARLGKDVIEMPVDPDSKFNSILKRKINNQAYSKSYTRSSYLLLKDGKGYKAYIMTIVGDSSYIKGNPGKLANNTYRQHDADFSGLVLYFTPKGKYVNGYAYKNGQLVTPASQTQATGKTRVQLVMQCTDWYYDVYVNGVLVGSVYLYTTCTAQNPNDPGSSGTPAPPNPCDTPVPPPPTNPNPPSTPNQPPVPPVPLAIPGHIAINNVPGGGGFPPPIDEDDPCPNELDIKNKVKDSCLNNMVDKLLSTDLNGKITDLLQNVFNTSDKVNLDFKDFNDPTAAPATTDPLSHSLFGNVYKESINLNTAKLIGTSQEYAAIVTIHEILHAYMNKKGGYQTQLAQHQEMAENYINDMRGLVQQIYPINDADANALILNGFGDIFNVNPPYWSSLLTKYKTDTAHIIATRDNYKAASGYGTKCVQKNP